MPINQTIPTNELSFATRVTATASHATRLYPSPNIFNLALTPASQVVLSILPNELLYGLELPIISIIFL